jgi:hypothetical protein
MWKIATPLALNLVVALFALAALPWLLHIPLSYLLYAAPENQGDNRASPAYRPDSREFHGKSQSVFIRLLL